MISQQAARRPLIDEPINDNSQSKAKSDCIYRCCLPRRYCVVLMLFWGLFNVYAMRVNLSFAIEPMSCQFNWSSLEEGSILSAFFVGYLFGNIPGGLLTEKYGGKYVFGIGVISTCLLTIILPICTSGSLLNDISLSCYCSNSNESGWCFNKGNFTNNDNICSHIYANYEKCNEKSNVWILILLRFFTGIFESVTFPAMYGLLNHWTVPAERTKMIGISSAGMYFGNTIGFPVSSFIIASNNRFFGGWVNVFYLFSIIGIIWWFIFMFSIFDTPFNDKYISNEELVFLKDELPSELTTESKKNKENVSWKELLTNRVALVIYFTHFSHNWAFYTLLTELPTYLDDELNYDLSSAGFISIIPYLGQFLVSSFGSILIDVVIARNILSVGNARKSAQTMGTIIPGLLLIACGYINDATYIVILLSVATPLMGFVIPGISSNYSDVSPTLSNVMYGIGNTFCTLSGVISPILCGWILHGNNKTYEWKLIFYISGIIVAFGTILFWIFGTGDKVKKLNVIQSDIPNVSKPSVNESKL